MFGSGQIFLINHRSQRDQMFIVNLVISRRPRRGRMFPINNPGIQKNIFY